MSSFSDVIENACSSNKFSALFALIFTFSCVLPYGLSVKYHACTAMLINLSCLLLLVCFWSEVHAYFKGTCSQMPTWPEPWNFIYFFSLIPIETNEALHAMKVNFCLNVSVIYFVFYSYRCECITVSNNNTQLHRKYNFLIIITHHCLKYKFCLGLDVNDSMKLN